MTAGDIGEEEPIAHLELTDRASVPYDQALPSTSTADSYGGVYSGEAWLAFPRYDGTNGLTAYSFPGTVLNVDEVCEGKSGQQGNSRNAERAGNGGVT